MKKVLIAILVIIILLLWAGLYLFYMNSLTGKIILYTFYATVTVAIMYWVYRTVKVPPRIKTRQVSQQVVPSTITPLSQNQNTDDQEGEVVMGFARTLVIALLITISMVGMIMLISGYKIGQVNVGGILLGLVVAYLIFSFGKVENEEKAAMFVLGEPIGVKYEDGTEDKKNGDLTPGLYFAPWGIVEVKKENGTIFQDELPGNPEQIFRQEDEGPVPPGLFPPIRVKFGQPKDPNRTDFDDEDRAIKDDPYNIAMVVEVVPVISWHIGSATTFFRRMKTVENCRKILQDKAEGVFGDAFSSITPAKASLHLGETSQTLENVLREEVKKDGVVITDGYVKPFRYSHKLNTSVVEVSIATQNAKATVITAEGDKQKALKQGEAIAKNREILLIAESVGAAKLAEVAKLPEGQITLWMQTMSKAFEKANYSIVPGSDVFTAFTGISEAVKQIDLRRTKP